VGDEGDFLEPKLIQNRGEVPSLRDLFVTVFGMGRQAHASQVGNDDSVVFNERIGERHPHIAGIAEAMKKQDGRSLAAEANVLSAASHRYLLGTKSLRPNVNRHDDVLQSLRLRTAPWR
jgi:hypothetical protein